MARAALVLPAFIVVALFGAPAYATPATTSFDQLHLILKVGEKITVRGTDQSTLRGRVLDVSPTALTVRVKGQPVVLAEHDVARVTARRRDAVLKDGLIAGAVPGIIAGSFASVEGKAVAVAAGLIWGGMFAGVTMGIDALVQKRVIYERSVTSRQP